MTMTTSGGSLDARGDGFATPEELLAHATWVRALARELVRDASAADDLVQETWLAALRHPPRSGGSTRPWLARVVRNLATSRGRSEDRRSAREERRASESHGRQAPSADDIAAALETQKLLLAAVERLREPLRAAVVRRWFHGKTSVEIAAEDGIADSTVRTRLEQALEELRRDLDAHHRGDRGAWVALVLPLAARGKDPLGVATGASATTLVGVVITMNTLVKIGIATAAVLAALGSWTLWKSDLLAPPGHERIAEKTAPIDADREVAVAPTTANGRVPLATSSDPITNTLAPVSSGEAVLEAQIVDEHDGPIPGATMTCVPAREVPLASSRPAPTTTSDARGVVRLVLHSEDQAQFGSFSPEQAPGEWRSTVHLEGRETTAREMEASFRVGQAASLGKLVLYHAGDVVGRVVDPEGRAQADIDVYLVMPDSSNLPTSSYGPTKVMKSAADGSFALRRMPIGVYRVRAVADWTFEATSDVFDIRVGEEHRVPDLTCGVDPNAIEGILLNSDGTPCRAAEIGSTTADGKPGPGTSPRRDGRFTLPIRAGCVVDLHATGFCGEARANGIASGTKDLVLHIDPLVDVDVLVETNSGEPLTRYELGWVAKGGLGSSRLNAGHVGGRAHLQLPPEPVTIWVNADGFAENRMTDVDPRRATKPLVFVLQPQPTLSIRVTREGSPVPYARVLLTRLTRQAEQQVTNGFRTRPSKPSAPSQTDASGRITLTCRETGRYIAMAMAGDSARTESEELELGPTVPSRELELKLVSGSVLDGRVLTDPDDASRAHYVTVSRGDTWTTSTPIGPDGVFHFEHMMAGTWWIRRTIQDYGDSSETCDCKTADPTASQVTVVEGPTTHFDLDLRGRATPMLEGKLAIPDVDLRAWTAHLEIKGAYEFAGDAAALQSDGSFRLVLPLKGRARLSLVSVATAERKSEIQAEIDLEYGTNRWLLDAPIGSLAIDAGAGGHAELSIATRCANGATFTTTFRPKDGEPLANVPAGRARLVDAKSGAVLAEVDVPAGAAAHVTIP